MVNQGENGANPDGLASISTQSERKSVYKKHGSDNSFHPRVCQLKYYPQQSTTEDMKILYGEINRIGNNINQIARSVNAGIASQEDAAEAVFLMKKVYDLMEKVASD